MDLAFGHSTSTGTSAPLTTASSLAPKRAGPRPFQPKSKARRRQRQASAAAAGVSGGSGVVVNPQSVVALPPVTSGTAEDPAAAAARDRDRALKESGRFLEFLLVSWKQ